MKKSGATKRHFLGLAFLAVSTFLAYSDSLHGTWAMDDVIAGRPVGSHDIKELLSFRKVAYFTFLLNQAIAPFNTANFRLFNIFIHLLNALLVYVLAYRTMLLVSEGQKQEAPKLPGFRAGDKSFTADERTAFPAAILCSVVFALHPININAVAYIVQRMASLATLFVLLSLLCYIAAFRSRERVKNGVFYALSGIFAVAGTFSKENAVVAIPLILLYDYVFLSKFHRRDFMKRAFVVAGAGIVIFGFSSFFLGFHHTLIDIAGLVVNLDKPLTERGWTAVDVYWTPLQHILTEFRVVSRYLFLVCLPLPQFLVFDWWGFPVSTGIAEPVTTLFSIAWLLTLLVFSLWGMRRLPLLCFGILWYLTAISLESFFAVGADIYFEHRNYLPVSGLFIGIIGQIVLSLKGRISGRAVWSAAIILSLVLAPLTFLRNFVWKDSVTLWTDTLKKSPYNIRAMMSLGNAYMEIPDFNAAKSYYEKAVTASVRDKRLHSLDDAIYRLGLVYLFEKNLAQAKRLIQIADSMIESSDHIGILKAFYKTLSGDIDGAIADYNKVLPEVRSVDSTVTYTLMGDAYRAKGMWDDALDKYNAALKQDMGFAAAYYGIGMAYLGKRNIASALEYIDRALSLEPNNILALSDKADLMLITKKATPEEALVYAQRAISKSPPFYQPYLTMGAILTILGREKEADDSYKKAVERKAPDYMVPLSRARAYYIKGDPEKTRYYLSEVRKYRLPENVKAMLQQNQP